MRWKTRSSIILFLFFTYLIVLVQFPSPIATDVDYNVPYLSGTGPTIDGSISAAEWMNQTPQTLSFNFTDGTIEVELYLLHNASAFFIGINVTVADDELNETDAFYIYLDEDHNGLLAGNSTLPKEEGIKLTRNNSFTDLSYNGAEWIDDETIVNLTKGPSKGATDGTGQWEFMIFSIYDPDTRILTNSSDCDVDLPSTAIEGTVEIGFNIEYYDVDINQSDSFTTGINGTVNNTASVWDDLIFGRVPKSPPNMAAIWAFIIIGMIVPAGLILYVLFWLKKKETV